jgi:DNA phosphorothioation-associated putative methyltransferase
MLPSQSPTTAQRPYRDGFLTARGTFQRYFAHDELKAFVEGILGERCVTLSPGIVTVFRDKELEQEVAYRRRSRAALIAEGFVVPPRPTQPMTVAPSVRERIQPELENIWRSALALGRPPEAREVDAVAAEALVSARVSIERAIALACDGTFDQDLLREAALARREDLLVHFALSLFPGAPRYASLAKSLQRDVKTFFRSHAAAVEEAKRLLFSAGDRTSMRTAAEAATQAGLGGLLGDTFVFTPSVLARLPPPLRVLHGCAEILHDDLNAAHFLQLPLGAPVLIAITCDDPSRHFPAIRSRVEIDLQALRARRRGRGGSVLYLKSAYLTADDPLRPVQSGIDQQLLARGVVTGEGEGPLWEELQTALKAKA